MDSPTGSLKINVTNSQQNNSQALLTVMSEADDNFASKYEKLEEIGRGGFSVVYKCRDRISNEIYAVKVVDLRPLRLRERFNPARLRREVDIMRRLRNPNIIQFIAVYETPDQLLMVLEYAPGMELFDVILERRFFTGISIFMFHFTNSYIFLLCIFEMRLDIQNILTI
jgi:serine/threonine protein kinase